ncbi:hypothetical protein [Kitasatospora sp. A2-31]|nr:hypothetical protein [Kitasatospora sp. A2-31]MCG6495349.1 hypothetical protein [Kitasatospora sp. A2-31]
MSTALIEAVRPAPSLEEIADFEAWVAELQSDDAADREFSMRKIAA